MGKRRADAGFAKEILRSGVDLAIACFILAHRITIALSVPPDEGAAGRKVPAGPSRRGSGTFT